MKVVFRRSSTLLVRVAVATVTVASPRAVRLRARCRRRYAFFSRTRRPRSGHSGSTQPAFVEYVQEGRIVPQQS